MPGFVYFFLVLFCVTCSRDLPGCHKNSQETPYFKSVSGHIIMYNWHLLQIIKMFTFVMFFLTLLLLICTLNSLGISKQYIFPIL